MKTVWIVLGIIVVVVLMVGGWWMSGYNRFVGLRENVKAQWAQVENQMQRRNDLIPNLVNTVKGYAKHEKEIFEYIAAARAQLAGARTVGEKIAANQTMDSALSRLLVIVEQYPNLKANENFIRLQDELAGTENRLAVERQRYNESVQEYNITLQQFPAMIIARLSGFEKNNDYFKAEAAAKQTPKVEF
ncbi:MAG: LemA family protein [Endomicrobiales bacterium]